MNKAELIDAMAAETHMTKADSGRALDAFLNATTKSLKKGEKLTLVGFGTFSVTKRPARRDVIHKLVKQSKLLLRKLLNLKQVLL
jgi:DNA-binding protein HU-beta